MSYTKLTPAESDAIERRLLQEMAARYGKVLERYGKPAKRKEEQMSDTTTTALLPVTDIIRVTQLPIIEEQLNALKTEIEQQTSEAMQLICNADTIQTVKDMRAELNHKFNALEDARKKVKKAIMEPYDRLEETYKECVTDPFKRANADLARKINETEGAIKRECEGRLQSYFNELRAVNGLPWLDYERAGVTVDMASAKAKTPKKLMEQLRLFVDGVAANVKTIDGMEDSAEIMAEYKATLDLSRSIATVQERKRRVEAERQAAKERAATEAAEAAAVAKVEAAVAVAPVAPPVEVKPEPEPELTVTFTATATRAKLLALREWMTKEGIKYR